MEVCMFRFIQISLVTAASAVAGTQDAKAQEVSLVSSYITDEGFNLSGSETEDRIAPAVQGSLSREINEHCSADIWGSKTLASKVGDELDVGVSCRFEINDDVEVEASAEHWFLAGDDINAFSISASKKVAGAGKIDVGVEHYLWKQQDGTRVQVGFSPTVIESFDLRFVGTYETGLGLPDIVTMGATAQLHLDDRWSIGVQAVLPVHRVAGDPRNWQVATGVTFRF
jgi:hypothetical protein